MQFFKFFILLILCTFGFNMSYANDCQLKKPTAKDIKYAKKLTLFMTKFDSHLPIKVTWLKDIPNLQEYKYVKNADTEMTIYYKLPPTFDSFKKDSLFQGQALHSFLDKHVPKTICNETEVKNFRGGMVINVDIQTGLGQPIYNAKLTQQVCFDYEMLKDNQEEIKSMKIKTPSSLMFGSKKNQDVQILQIEAQKPNNILFKLQLPKTYKANNKVTNSKIDSLKKDIHNLCDKSLEECTNYQFNISDNLGKTLADITLNDSFCREK